MGRKRKIGVAREPNGREQREPQAEAAEAKRVLSQLLRQSRDAQFGTAYGQMFVLREIDEHEFAQAKRVAGMLAAYRRALAGPKGLAGLPVERGAGGAPVDPETPEGIEEAERHKSAVHRYDAVCDRLRWRGQAVMQATVKLCGDEYLTWQEREWAKIGLGQLVLEAQGGRRK